MYGISTSKKESLASAATFAQKRRSMDDLKMRMQERHSTVKVVQSGSIEMAKLKSILTGSFIKADHVEELYGTQVEKSAKNLPITQYFVKPSSY